MKKLNQIGDKYCIKFLGITVINLLMIFCVRAQKLLTYPFPTSETSLLHNSDFTVKVRKPDGKWQQLYEYNIKVDDVHGTYNHVENATMCSFDFSGAVEVAVTFNKGEMHSARIRPLSYDISHEVKGNTLYFKLSKPRNLSVEVNGDIFHNLHLFANPIQTFVPDLKDTDLIYFGPGVHHLKDNRLYVPSGKTVYLAGGAVLMGQVLFEHVRNARLLGRGMIAPSVKMGVHIAYSKNITVEGIVCTQCATGGSDSVTIRNVKAISYYGWGDGMNVFSSNYVTFDNVFCRNSDDCTTVYGTRLGFTGGCNHILMKNATLWADVAHPILIGTHGNASHPDTLQNIEYDNIDILDHNEMQVDYQGCMSIDAGDNNFIRNVKFENIRVEDFRRGQLLNLRVFFNKKYCKAPGRAIENILFKNVRYKGSHSELSIISGYDSSRKIQNVLFDNLVINGVKISDHMKNKPTWYKTSDMARFFVGEDVENIQFK
ncbi:glycosyl hydrolase family 28 protein [Arachidicoccus sp.]|uniref:glycosyl hydrolase family 28 protein n=1 Tax=Arachidicoccus sp. TaxID=1872624 RepID=UPI003D1D1EE4